MNLWLARKLGDPLAVAARNSFGSLRRQCTMIHALNTPYPCQLPVLVSRPKRAPFPQALLTIPFPGFHASQSGARGLAKRKQNMSVMIVGMVALRQNRFVNGNVRHHAFAHESLMDEL